MSNLLANIFSAADSLKRVVGDALTSPVLAAQQAIGYGVDRKNKQQEDAATTLSKSVLVPEWQKVAAMSRVADNVGTADSMVGDALTGMIVPARSIAPFAVGTAQKLIDGGKAQEAYEQFRMFFDPVDNMLKSVISDAGRIKPFRHDPGSGQVVAPKVSDNVMATDLMTRTDDLPGELVKLLAQTKVIPASGKGAYYSAIDDTIGLGASSTQTEAASKLLHEGGHGSQYMYDMSRGGSPEFFLRNPEAFREAKNIASSRATDMVAKGGGAQMRESRTLDANSLLALPHDQLMDNPRAMADILRMFTAVSDKAHALYKGLPGEVEARLVQRQFERNDYVTPPWVLRDTMLKDMTMSPKTVPKVDADPVTQTLIKALLGK